MVKIKITSLDALIGELGWPDVHVVKIDTEGAEPLVLRGMREVSRRNENLKLVVEFSPPNLDDAETSPDELLAELVDLGFLLVTVLARHGKRFELPRDARPLLDFARPLGPVANLLCEKPLQLRR